MIPNFSDGNVGRSRGICLRINNKLSLRKLISSQAVWPYVPTSFEDRVEKKEKKPKLFEIKNLWRKKLLMFTFMKVFRVAMFYLFTKLKYCRLTNPNFVASFVGI